MSQEKIDLEQLKQIGTRVNKAKSEVEQYWKRVNKLQTSSMPELMVMYGRYLTNITNDVEEGEELIACAQTMIDVQNAKKKDLNYFMLHDDISKILIPLVIVSGQPKQIGTIVNVNLPCCAIFGYTKKDLVGKNIRVLVPDIIKAGHDRYIENVIEKKRVNFFNMGRIVYAKHQSEYIMPVSIRGKMFMGENIFFAATLRVLHAKHTIGALMVDENGVILEISAGCYILFGISIKTLQIDNKLEKYLPGFFSQIRNFVGSNPIALSETMLSNILTKQYKGRQMFASVEQHKYIGMTNSVYLLKITG